MAMIASQQNYQLAPDILYIIAEKMFFNNSHFGTTVDLRVKNVYTMFMFHSTAHLDAVYAQMAKMKRIEFTQCDKREIRLYKHKEFLTNWQFGGPYCVPAKLISEMISLGKMNVSVVDFNNGYINDKFEIKQNGMSSLEVFSAWLLGKDLDVVPSNTKFAIEKLRVNESFETIKQNFEAFLLLNAEAVEFCNYGTALIFDCSSFTSKIGADKTKKIVIKSDYPEDFICEMENFNNNWKSMIDLLLSSCPNLVSLEFEFGINFSDPNAFTESFHSLLKEITNCLLKELDKGNEALQIMIQFTASCDESVYEELPLDNHELYNMGAPHTVDWDDDDPYTARAVEVIDKIGREHKCVFRVFPEKIENSEMDDYDNYMDNYDDEYSPVEYDDENDYDDDDDGY